MKQKQRRISFFVTSLLITNLISLPTQPGATPTHYPKLAQAYTFLLADQPQEIVHNENKIALTFDADMTVGMKNELEQGSVSSWYNQELIHVLEKHQVKATLFLTGMWAELYPNEAKQLAQNPLFEIGDHSYDHMAFTPDCYGLPSISDSEDEANVVKSQEVLTKILGFRPQLFRFPGLCHDDVDIQTMSHLGLQVIDGDVTADDGFTQDTQRIVDEVMSQVKPGSIVVAHMHGGTIAPKTAEAMEILIPLLQEKYQLVTVSELSQ